ncbi:TPA: hypothetical protein ACN30M_001346 [Vibrio parahaemolyticus]
MKDQIKWINEQFDMRLKSFNSKQPLSSYSYINKVIQNTENACPSSEDKEQFLILRCECIAKLLTHVSKLQSGVNVDTGSMLEVLLGDLEKHYAGRTNTALTRAFGLHVKGLKLQFMV